MIMGQSAGTIAALTLPDVAKGGAVHDIDTSLLHAALLAGGQLMNGACVKPTGPPTPPPPPAPHAAAYTVSGAGNTASNGVYKFDPSQHRDAGVAFYTKDGSRQLYRIDGVWRIADSGEAVYYESASNTLYPPFDGWSVVTGAKPVPTLGNHSHVH